MWSWKKLAVLTPSFSRSISLSSVREGKRNFRKFVLPLRGTQKFKEAYKKGEIKVDYGPRPRREIPITFRENGVEKVIPEKIPELIVPDLTDCDFKPYVSYQAPNVVQSAFSAKDLFDAVYKKKIVKDHKEGKLGPDGESLEPSVEEQLTPLQAFINARKTGSDIF